MIPLDEVRRYQFTFQPDYRFSCVLWLAIQPCSFSIYGLQNVNDSIFLTDKEQSSARVLSTKL